MSSKNSYNDYAEAVAHGQGIAGDKAFILTKAQWKDGSGGSSSGASYYWVYQLLSSVADDPDTPYALLENVELWCYPAQWVRIRPTADDTDALNTAAPDGNGDPAEAAQDTENDAIVYGESVGVGAHFMVAAVTDPMGRTYYQLDSLANLVGDGGEGLVAITSSSIANPSIITAPDHGIPPGEVVVITIASHASVTPDINGQQTATGIDENTLSIPVNVTNDGTGGTLTYNGVDLTQGETLLLVEGTAAYVDNGNGAGSPAIARWIRVVL